MESSKLVMTALMLLGVAALGGLVMAGMRFSGRDRPPSWLAMLHGLLAAAGLTLLVYAALVLGVSGMAKLGTLILVLAALGGLYLNLGFHDKQLPLPKGIVIVHALIAVVGVALVFLGG